MCETEEVKAVSETGVLKVVCEKEYVEAVCGTDKI